jgi:hypothetical protein
VCGNANSRYQISSSGGQDPFSGGGGVKDTSVEITLRMPPPVVTNPSFISFLVEEEIEYSIAATNYPTSYSAEGLPSGLSVNPETGLITGITTFLGCATVVLYATNESGTGSKTVSICFDIRIKVQGNQWQVLYDLRKRTEEPETYFLVSSSMNVHEVRYSEIYGTTTTTNATAFLNSIENPIWAGVSSQTETGGSGSFFNGSGGVSMPTTGSQTFKGYDVPLFAPWRGAFGQYDRFDITPQPPYNPNNQVIGPVATIVLNGPITVTQIYQR